MKNDKVDDNCKAELLLEELAPSAVARNIHDWASASVEQCAADGIRTQQVLHPGRQLWVPLGGFKMQTAGAMVFGV